MGHRRTAAVAALTLSLLGFSDAVRLPTLSSLRRTPVAARHASCVNCAAEAESVSADEVIQRIFDAVEVP